jgi:hypothetical protein
MDDFIVNNIGKITLVYIGGTIRFVFGTLWNIILKNPNNTYMEYIQGKNNKDTEEIEISFINRIIGFIFLFIIASMLVNYFP